MSDWLDYQKLTAAIYAELQPGSQVIHDDKIQGFDTGVMRQIDVSVRTKIAGHDLLIIVDAKNHSRPLDINAIGAFASLVKDVRAAKGVLVCNSEFTAPAIKYATDQGIDLCTVHDASSRSWGMRIRVPMLWIEHAVTVDFDWALLSLQAVDRELRLPTRILDYKFRRGKNGPIVPVFETFAQEYNAHRVAKQPNVRHSWPVPCDDLHVVFDSDYWFRVESLNLGYWLEPKGWLGQIQLGECKGLRNVTTGELRARLGLRGTDIPKMRDAGWTPVDDIPATIAKSSPLVTIEHSGIDLSDVQIDGFNVEVPPT